MSEPLNAIYRRATYAPPPPEQGISARFVLAALRRWWKVALPAALLLSAVGCTIVYMLFEPVYEAAAWFQIEERTPYLAFESRDDGRSKLFFQTQIVTIRSPLVLGPVVKRPEIAKAAEISRQADKVDFLSKRVKVMSVGDSEVFRIVYAGPDPTDAANVVNAVTESYFKLRDQTDAERNQRIIDLLTQEKDKRSREVMRLRDNLRALAENAADKDPLTAKVSADAAQKHPLADLESKLIQAQVEGAVLEARIKAAEEELAPKKDEGKSPPDAGEGLLSSREIALRDVNAERLIEESDEVRRLKDIISAKRSNLAETERLAAKGKKSSIVERLAAEIRSDEQTLERMRAEMKPRALREAELAILTKRTEMEATNVQRRMEELAKMRSDRAACRETENMLQERYDKQRKNVGLSSGEALELSFKLDELARAEKVFEMISQRAMELQTERGAPARVKLMQRAEPPAAPVEKFPYRAMAAVLLLCFSLPFALAVFGERMLGRVTDPVVLERQSKLAVLGEIANLPLHRHVRRGSANARSKHDMRLFEESIDSLRTSLSLSKDLADLRILAVTSAANREGKTSVVSQLAVSFVRATGNKVLLIDGDMRCPDIHNVFDVELEPGLAQVLGGEAALEDAIVTSWSESLHLLPAGRLTVNPHTLLGNGAWKSLLEQIPPCYRYVLIDTPPVLSASEALVFAKAADASLVCVMRGVSRVDQLHRILDRLEAAGGRTVGLVLNGVPAKDYSYRWGDYSYSRD